MKKDDSILIDDVIKEYTPLIKKYCITYREIKNFDADDITSDVMLLLIEKWDKMKKDNIKAWLYRVADIYIKRYLSKRAKSKEYITESMELLEEEHKEPLIYDDYTPFLFEEKIVEWKQEIYQKLTEDEQILYELRYNKKMTLQKISKKLSTPYATLHHKYTLLEEKIINIIKEITDTFSIV